MPLRVRSASKFPSSQQGGSGPIQSLTISRATQSDLAQIRQVM